MKWIVQNNLYNEAGYVRFIEALDRLGCDYTIVKPVPFTNRVLPADFDSMTQDLESTPDVEFDTDQKIMCMGATSLTRIAKANGWKPGTYNTDSFDFEVWRDGFGKENILNGDSVVGTVSDISIPAEWDWIFVRPTLDTKAFTGMVLSKHDLHDWRLQIGQYEEEEFVPLHKNTPIAAALAKKIHAEYRLFCVRKPVGVEIVTSSQYKLGEDVTQIEGCPHDIEWFASRMINHWQPADAFVVDIAATADGPKVIEINTINSAGFYQADVQKIVMALEDLNI